MSNNNPIDPSQLPFVAPCRKVSDFAPLRWLKLGVDDLRAAPRQGLVYGFLTVLVSWAMTFITIQFGTLGFYFGLVSGFVFCRSLVGSYALCDKLNALKEGKKYL
ncbi:MAG: hypothetical protein LRY63_09445 [Nitrincola sp.]|nr:hypothetical protein [Nitrincola sp.]